MRDKLIERNAQLDVKIASLLKELATIPAEALLRAPSGGGWSAMQTAWHLMLVDEKSLQYVFKKLSYGGDFEKAGLGGWWRMLLLKLALLSPIKFRAPQGSSADNLPPEASLAELQERWLASRGQWLAFLAQMPDILLDRAVYKHPRAGRISWMQTLNFLNDHFDRHLKQLRQATLG